ncbi:hypothetical protein KP79_PYT03440 [Mizuhopecten yessoensis]|uniref:Methyltransferase FkbM domain-containing protein n=1 Tax=Mizuhopecten yessoensis TaxID=6573 RepID=A0A210PDG3_MIZYE|nr:hypothetical protein KP79_PYT03440 [Mizuhopecten yessoensis]
MRLRLPFIFHSIVRLRYILLSFVLVVTMWLILFHVRRKQPITVRSSSSANLLLHMLRNTTKHSKSTSVTPTKSKVKVLSRGEQGTWSEQTDMCDVRPEFVRAKLKDPGNTPIFVYDKVTDAFVSGSIINVGMWEGDLVKMIHDFLKEDPERVFLDLGSNVGVFSLMAAKIGHKVFSVDMLLGNVQRLCASCIAGHFPDHVTIIHNALSDVRGTASFGTY